MEWETFSKQLEQDLFAWISKRERPASHWFMSLAEWASMREREAWTRERAGDQ